MKIYLVEDSDLVRLRLIKLLNAIDGVKVVGSADTPGKALADIAALEPDSIVIDMKLKEGTGLDVLMGLANLKSDAVPIVMTNSIHGALVEACRAAGAQFIFDKTIELDQVLLTVRRLMAAHRVNPF